MALLFSTPFVDVLVIGGGWRWLAAFGVVVAIGLTRRGGRDRGHGRAVPPDRPEPHPAGGANPRRRDRRRFRHRVADCRDPVLRHLVAVRGADLGCRFGLRARARQRRLVAGARRARRRRGAAAVCWPAASCCSAPSWRSSRRALPTPSSALRPTPATARQGPRARAFRAGSRQQALRWKEFVLLKRDPWLLSQSLMQLLYLVPPALLLWRSFADSDAAARADHACDRDGRGTTRRRPRLADDFGRGRPRPGGDRAVAGGARDPRQDRGGADRDRRHLCAAAGGAGLCRAAAGGGHRARHHHRGGIGHRDPALVPACRPGAASSAAARPRRGSPHSRKPSPRSAGPRPRCWCWRCRSPG